MRARKQLVMAFAALLSGAAAPAAFSETISITGSAQAEVEETRFGQPGDREQAIDSFPGTSAELPLQVIAQLVAAPNEIAAASAAAQFGDPRLLYEANPGEFALNVALNSVTEATRYVARVRAHETRGILFSEGELGAQPAGTIVPLTGRLFIDAVLAVYGNPYDRDLTGAAVSLAVDIVQRVPGHAPLTVFEGKVELVGGAHGAAEAVTGGNFPRFPLIIVHLPQLTEDFGAFHLLVVPNLTIDYAFDAAVGEEFTLEANVAIAASNVEHEGGVFGVVGTPITSLQNVFASTMGDLTAAKVLTAVEKARQDPTGEPAFPEAQLQPSPPFGLCGLLGFESLLGLTLLAGLRFAGLSRFYPRTKR
ncbi:MAG: hypothetical protein KKB50_00890 [Planctomycetes bacterium]|nr:hypothetical protein [Planctomycetota bacterium]